MSEGQPLRGGSLPFGLEQNAPQERIAMKVSRPW